MSYTDWRDWALGEGTECPDDNQETWRRVAENADRGALYENPDTQPGAYRNALGECHPTTKEQFNAVCRDADHQLTGAPVEGTVPDYLARCVPRQALKTQVNERIEIRERAGRNFRRTSSEDHAFNLSDVPSDEWGTATKTLPDPVDNLHLSYFKSNRVFSTLGVRDEDGEGAPTTFYEHLRKVQRPDHSLAEEAVYRLALSRSADSPRERLILLYETDPFNAFRYPVPPDAEFWPLFRPVENGEPHDFGRTCPGGHPCDEERDEPELVHANPLISSDRMWMRSL